MGSTLTTFAAFLKERYMDEAGQRLEELTYPENVLFSMLEKRGDTDMQGSDLHVAMMTALPQGLGQAFATAQTNSGGVGGTVRGSKWVITAGDYYGAVAIGDKLLAASGSNKGAMLTDKVTEIDGLYEQAGENLSVYTWGNGGQKLGRRSSASTNDITLVDSIDAQNFEIGMLVVASDNDGSDAAHALRGGTSTAVTAVNRATGVITLASAAAITSFADGDYLFRESDFFGTTGLISIKGLQSFIPATDAGVNNTLWGITGTTRLTDPQRFGGCRVDVGFLAGKPIDERLKILIAQMTGRFKAKAPDAIFLNPEDFQQLDTLLGAKSYRETSGTATTGFTKINLGTTAGMIPIYCDRHCPLGHAFAFRMQDWWISSMKELLHPQMGDGLEILRKATATDYEFRLISYPLLACKNPKNTGRVALY